MVFDIDYEKQAYAEYFSASFSQNKFKWRKTKMHDTQQHDKSLKFLLTGTTGFLGGFILNKLLRLYPNAIIYCIIRHKTPFIKRIELNFKNLGFSELSISDKSRIKLVPCDYSNPVINEKYIEHHIDMIYHIGCKTSYTMDYNEARTNVVQMLVSLIEYSVNVNSEYPIPIIYTGSCISKLCDFYGDSNQIDNGLYRGYSQSKYICNYILDHLRSTYNYPSQIYDVGYLVTKIPIMIDYSDPLESLFKLIIEIGYIPDINICFDQANIDDVADTIIAKSIDTFCNTGSNGNGNGNGNGNYSVYNEPKYTWNDLNSVLKLEKISIKLFIQKIETLMANTHKFKQLSYLKHVVTDDFEEQMNVLYNSTSTNVNNLLKNTFSFNDFKLSLDFIKNKYTFI
jgi:thioester reductase-like protein